MQVEHTSPTVSRDPGLLTPTSEMGNALTAEQRCESAQTLVDRSTAVVEEGDRLDSRPDKNQKETFETVDEVQPIGLDSDDTAERRQTQTQSARGKSNSISSNKSSYPIEKAEYSEKEQYPVLLSESPQRHSPSFTHLGRTPSAPAGAIPFSNLTITLTHPTIEEGQIALPDEDAVQLSKGKKWVLLAIFSCAQFLDIVSVSGATIALADVEKALNLDPALGTWVVNAYAIAFAGFLLLAGRVSDIYNPKYVFVGGFFTLGCFALGVGLSTDPIMLFCFRGLQGMGGAMTIPSALNSIMHVFPEKQEQASALAVFSSSGALGSVLGLILAGILLLLSWRWCFLFIGVGALPLSAVCMWLLPNPRKGKKKAKKGKTDVGGVFLLTSGLILLIYSLTTGSTNNVWTIPSVLAPLCISVAVLLPAFFWWETKVSPSDALIPPKTWKLPGFLVLFAVAMTVYGWFMSVIVPFTVLWQSQYGLSAIQTSLRFLPLGITGGCITIHAAIKPSHYRPKYLLAPSMALCAIASTMLVFASKKEDYFKIVLPAFVIGTCGGACSYVCCNIAIMQSSPEDDMAGVLGAIFNSALQVGLTIIVAIITALQATVSERSPAGSYAPYRAGLYFMIALMATNSIIFAVFYREPVDESGKRREVVIHA